MEGGKKMCSDRKACKLLVMVQGIIGEIISNSNTAVLTVEGWVP